MLGYLTPASRACKEWPLPHFWVWGHICILLRQGWGLGSMHPGFHWKEAQLSITEAIILIFHKWGVLSKGSTVTCSHKLSQPERTSSYCKTYLSQQDCGRLGLNSFCCLGESDLTSPTSRWICWSQEVSYFKAQGWGVPLFLFKLFHFACNEYSLGSWEN